MVAKGSITHWIHGAKAGEERAIQKLWERYYARIVHLARRKLEGRPRRVADEEDVALAAFNSFCLKARAGRFPDLADRDGLWRLLVRITACKALDQIKWDRRQRRKAKEVALSGNEEQVERVVGYEPTPDFASYLAEEVERLLEGLGDRTLRQVAVWKMEGCTNAEIAMKLDCGERTVARKLELIRKLLKDRRRA